MLEVPARRLVNTRTQTSGLESLLFYAIEVSLKKFRKPKLNQGLSTLKFISSMLTENTLFAVFHESASQEEGLIAVTVKYLEHLEDWEFRFSAPRKELWTIRQLAKINLVES